MIRSLAVTILVSCALLSRGAAQEITLDSARPVSVGIPVRAGEELGVYVMWDAPADAPSHEVFIRIELQWTPVNLLPRPVSALPFQVDVRFGVSHNTFPVPPGRHEWAYEFELPVGGHLLLAGGHLHDYGESVRLEDVATGKRLLFFASRRDSN